ncbi:MAG: phosphoenolpyruvate synthase [Candidatus Pacearchaeota archaeon]
MKDGFILWLSELRKEDVPIAGGKGANLGEMYNEGFPVPPAFVITTKAFEFFLDKTNLRERITFLLSKIDIENTKQLNEKSEEIKKLIISSKMPEELQKEILEAYDNLNIEFEDVRNAPNALAIIKTAREPPFVSVRSSATAEDLGNASFAGQQESYINVKGNKELIEKVKAVFASIFTPRSIYYRIKQKFDAFTKIAVIVQRMINSDKSGVIFSLDPINQKDILIEAVFGQGEGIVSGRIKPDEYFVSRDNLELVKEKINDKKIAIVRDSSGITKTVNLTEEKSKQRVLKLYEIKQLADYALRLEKHYGKPQDIEFAIENDEIFILQTRAITTLKERQENEELEGKVLLEGLGASPGIASGVVKIIRRMEDLEKIKKGDVLVTEMTNPDMVVSMQKASAIVTDEGGITSHAAIVSREMGIPCVVGTSIATNKLEDGMEITVDGFRGKVYLGKAESKKVQVLPIEVQTKTKIKVLVDLPDFAERAAKANAHGIGLIRLEGIIASSGKHPLWFKNNNKIEEYKELIKEGLERIAKHFIGKEMWVRTSDIRSDEYSHLEGAPKHIEKNPMLGNHGIRFSLKNIDLFKAELLAVKELSEKNHKFGIMFPQVISPLEVREAKKVMEELGMLTLVKVGVMIETPAAAILIRDICNEKIDFISFGTNDLTQFTLAVDRGNEEVQYLYDETNWAIKKQISRVIRECKFHNVETSICGQAASRKEMVEFLVDHGIDSITVNADIAKEMAEFVKSLEEKRVSS